MIHIKKKINFHKKELSKEYQEDKQDYQYQDILRKKINQLENDLMDSIVKYYPDYKKIRLIRKLSENLDK